jgi:hypothetical protein
MQSLLTTAIELAAATFILLMIADFTAMLITAWRNAEPQAQPQAELEPVAQEPAIGPQKVATLQWFVENMLAAEIYTTELPDAIVMAKSRLPKVAPAPVVQLVVLQKLDKDGSEQTILIAFPLVKQQLQKFSTRILLAPGYLLWQHLELVLCGSCSSPRTLSRFAELC